MQLPVVLIVDDDATSRYGMRRALEGRLSGFGSRKRFSRPGDYGARKIPIFSCWISKCRRRAAWIFSAS